MIASGPIISWQRDTEKWKQLQILFSWAPKSLWMVSAAMKFKKLKSRDITLPTKDNIVKAMVFPVVRYVCESWIIKKTECQINDSFEQGAREDS